MGLALFWPAEIGIGFDLDAVEHWSGSLSGSIEKNLVIGDELKLVGTSLNVDVDG